MDRYQPGGYNFLPPGVKNLLIINGLFFLATYVFAGTFKIDLTERMGLFYVGSEYFKPYQFITHLFMHGGMAHIFSNMFALWMFGSVIENRWGTQRFLIYYFVTGFGAAILHSLVTAGSIYYLQDAVETYISNPSIDTFRAFIDSHVSDPFLNAFNNVLNEWSANPNDSSIAKASISYVNELLELKKNIPTVGASGAVFGVLLAFGMMFPNTKIYLYFLFPIKAKYFVIAYGLFELFAGINNAAGDNVAHWAHLGGMIFGYFLIKHWNRNFTRFY